MKKITSLLYVAVVVAAAWLLPVAHGKTPVSEAPAVEAAAPVLDLQDGDTFVFLGDSITHQCLYTQYIENFFYTRYPERRIHFHNAGVSGDKALDALRRFEDDVAAFGPKYVSVLLGMNDGGYLPFDSEIFEKYSGKMTELIEAITAAGATPILMNPTMFDHHQLGVALEDPDYRFRMKEFSDQYNSVLAFFGAWVREQAVEHRYPFVNLWGPLSDVTMEQRRTRPDFTLLPDAIHPAAAGQFVMAYSFLWQLKPERKAVSSISLSRRGDAWRAGGSGGEIADVQGDEERVSFQFTAESLPWVVPELAYEGKFKWGGGRDPQVGYKLMNAGHRLSNERLKISGLAPGSYEVLIDGQSIGKLLSHVQLGTKIELQSNPNTPQYQQAMKVALLNRARNDQAMRPLRDLWGRIKGARKKFAEVPQAAPVSRVNLQPEIDALLQLAREFEDKIYAANQPVPRRYEVRRVK